MKKKAFISILCMLLAVIFSGCSILTSLLGNDFDMAGYVKGNLDSVYLGVHSEEFINMIEGADEESLNQDYLSGLEVEADYFISYFNIDSTLISQETRDRIIDLYKDIYSYSKYEVGEVTKSGDKYLVSVTVYPIDVIQQAVNSGEVDAFVETYNAKVESGEFSSVTEETEEYWADGMICIVEKYVPTIGYLEPQTISVQITQDTDGLYTFDSNDFARIDELMIAY